MAKLFKIIYIFLLLASFLIVPIQISEIVPQPSYEMVFQNNTDSIHIGYIAEVSIWLYTVFVSFKLYNSSSVYRYLCVIKRYLLSTLYKTKIEYLLNPVQFQSKLIVTNPLS